MPVLVVQRGHCYRQSGATGTTGEQAYATAVADACIRHLHGKAGWLVRATLADENVYAGDAFVAIHCDGSTNPSARGASVGYRTPEGQAFGQAWKRAYATRGWVGGFRPDNYTTALAQYYGTGNAVAVGTRRAVILECGFLTNLADRALLNGPGGADRVALAIGDALGIPHNQALEEDELNTAQDAALGQTWGTVVDGRNWEGSNLQRQLGYVVNEMRAGQASLAAAIAADDLDPEALASRLEAAAREAAAEGAKQAITTTVLPALREVLADALGQDNKSQADAIVDRLAERLNPAVSTEGN